MPSMSGLQLQNVLIEKNFRLPTILQSAYGDAQMGAQATKRGAIDFLQKPYRNQDLVDAVNAALRSSKDLMDKQAEKSKHRDCFESLSQREREILNMVVAGDSSKVIARMLGISHKTVEAHRARIMNKLGVKSTIDLIHSIVRNAGGFNSEEQQRF
jgi:two-component system response regulator TtrR